MKRQCNHLVGHSSGIYMPGDDLWEASDLKAKPERKNYLLDCGIAFKFCPKCGEKLPRIRRVKQEVSPPDAPMFWEEESAPQESGFTLIETGFVMVLGKKVPMNPAILATGKP